MERSLGLLLVLIAIMTIIHLVQAQDELGFISLDCGLPENEPSTYIESKTKLNFSSDAKFIQSGETGRIQTNPNDPLLKPYRTLRYFGEGIRNCYNLRVEKGRMYLIRAWFVYGNYDGLEIIPSSFDLYIGPNLWATVDMRESGNNTKKELLHIPTSDSLQICLVKNGKTTPFISSLELRPLGNHSYMTQSGSLKLLRRIYYTKSEAYVRYPDDAYDRIWTALSLSSFTHITTNNDVSEDGSYNLPKAVRQNAATQTNASQPLTIGWTSENSNDQYYMYEHLAEIQDLQANETREFVVFLNGNSLSNPATLKKYEIRTMESLNPETCEGEECSLQLTRTQRSTLPPLLNAFEIYSVIHFPQSETNEKDVLAIKSIKDAHKLNITNWQGDPCVPQQLRWDGLNCTNADMSTPPRITSLNLSSIGLTGTIAAAIQNLEQLENLDLSNNKLIGELPEFLGNIRSLLFINLSENDLSGYIPKSLQRNGVFLHGNPRLCHPDSSCSKPPSKKFLVTIVASVASVVIFIAALVLFLVLRKKKLSTVGDPLLRQRMSPMMNITRSGKRLIELKSKRFTYSEVITMTNNFQKAIGKGGFGEVYHGNLNDSEQVAVKVCNGSSTQLCKQFKAEVDLLLRAHHRYLVNLVGYCDEGNHLALIYEFVPNGDLKEHLSGKQGRPIINWGMRLKIAMEAAVALDYLHTGCKPSMIHRDVKTTNILLCEDFQAKLADFGLSRSSPVAGETHVSTVVAGTLGYLDPEYHSTAQLSEKSDVYSFGIVLLEMITNKPVIDVDGTRELSGIAQWVRLEVDRGEITRIMDPNLCVDYNSPSVWNALMLAISCTDPSSTKRPTMCQVLVKLKDCLASENLRGLSELC